MSVFSREPAQKILVSEVKFPLVEALEELDDFGFNPISLFKLWRAKQALDKLPEPTESNVDDPWTKTLIKLRDWFFNNEDNPSRAKVFGFLWKLVIIHSAHSGYYRYRLSRVAEKLREEMDKGNFPPTPKEEPRPMHWRETRIEGLTDRESMMRGERLKRLYNNLSENITVNGRCSCGGEVGKITKLDEVFPVWRGRCLVCGLELTILEEG